MITKDEGYRCDSVRPLLRQGMSQDDAAGRRLEPNPIPPPRGKARESQLAAYRHTGFWQPMDTLRDKNLLEGLWQSGKAPWKMW